VKFPYKKYPNGKGGFDSFGVIEVSIALPQKNAPRSKRFEAIIDSGACRCTFLSVLGKAIGLDVEKGEVESSMGISGARPPSHIYMTSASMHQEA
jgi:hypothetical protein